MRRICLAIVAKYKGFHETSIQFALVLFSNYGQIQCQLSLHRADIEGAITGKLIEYIKTDFQQCRTRKEAQT